MFSFLFGSGSSSNSANASTTPTTFKDIPELITQLQRSCSAGDDPHINTSSNANAIADATYEASKRLYGLCDVAHKYNRVPMLSGQDYDILTPVCETLMHPQTPSHTQQILCLTLNNLSVPLENKKIMSSSSIVIETLYRLISTPLHSQQATHYACICLVNLSHLEGNSILKYVHVTVGTDMTIGPVENPNSLLRKIELLALDGGTGIKASTNNNATVASESSLLLDLNNNDTTNSATASTNNNKSNALKNQPRLPTKVSSENQRWACALLKIFARQRDNAIMIGRTQFIPSILARALHNQGANQQSQQQLWVRNSVEESCLAIVVYLSRWATSRTALVQAGIPQVLQDYVEPMLETLELEKQQQQQPFGIDATAESSTPSLIVLSTVANAMLGKCPFDYFTTTQIYNVQKLMAQIYQHRDIHHDFGLATIVQGYKSIAKAAQTSPTAIPLFDSQQEVMMTLIGKSPKNQGDDEEDGDTTVSIVAPSTLALFYQLISDIVFEDELENEDEEVDPPHAYHDGTNGGLQVSDVMAAEHAVGAIEILLPLILQGSGDSGTSTQNTKRAVAEISMLLKNFSKIEGISSEAQESSKNAAYTMIKYCYDTPTASKPTLEQSHMNWIRKRFRPS